MKSSYFITLAALLLTGAAHGKTVTGLSCTTDSMLQISSKLYPGEAEYRSITISDDAKYTTERSSTYTGVLGQAVSTSIENGTLKVEIVAGVGANLTITAKEVQLVGKTKSKSLLFTGKIASDGNEIDLARHGLSRSEGISCFVSVK